MYRTLRRQAETARTSITCVYLAGEDCGRSWTGDLLSVWQLKSFRRTCHLVEPEASRQGQTDHTADGGVIKNKGEKTVTMYSETGDQYRARYQITDVTRPLNPVSRARTRNNVLFTQTRGWIINYETGRNTRFSQEHGVYVRHSWINESPTEKRVRWTEESFPGQECWDSAIP